ncbi:MAG: hypothetical protein KatS3mg051_1102 [Anaerolineae bacterium]|nr:MAG: hypothetical protein KatS3mg051_1102 [Anaerolineae bacterium]
METIKLSKQVGEDGILRLEMLVGANVDCDITIRVRPKLSQEEWRAFLEATAGSLADDPIERNQPLQPDAREDIV